MSNTDRFLGPKVTEGESNTSDLRKQWNSRALGDVSRSLIDRDARTFLHQSLSTPCMAAIRKAEGIWIEDVEGRRYMDFHGNSVHHIGYGHPRLVQAVTDQIHDLPFAPRRYTCEPAIELAEMLASRAAVLQQSPSDWKVLLTTGGSDAIETALKIARAKTGRFKTISFWDAFHGAGLGSASVGGEAMFRSHIAGPLLPGTEHVAPFSCYRCVYGYPAPHGQPDLDVCKMTCAQMIRYVLEKEGDVAAVVAEPSRAVPYVAPPGFWQAVRQACDAAGALLIFDEIPTGLGKTGRFFAAEHEGVTPDIFVLGKALGGGMLPIAAVLARDELNVTGDFAIGHYTHEKNPVTTRAALTTLEIIRDEGLAERADELGKHATERLRAMQDRHTAIGDIRGRGLLIGVELVLDRQEKAPANDLTESVFYHCLEAGLSFKITNGNTLTLSPPLTISQADLEHALDIVDAALTECR